MLHKNGVVVAIPAPERLAVHKLIVASRRRADDNGFLKRNKDVKQAELVVDVLGAVRRHADLAMAFSEAWKRGPSWREAIKIGFSYFPSAKAADLRAVVIEGLRDIGERFAEYDF